jgi:hypothetical protein
MAIFTFKLRLSDVAVIQWKNILMLVLIKKFICIKIGAIMSIKILAINNFNLVINENIIYSVKLDFLLLFFSNKVLLYRYRDNVRLRSGGTKAIYNIF